MSTTIKNIAPALRSAREAFARGWNAHATHGLIPDWSDEIARDGFRAAECAADATDDRAPKTLQEAILKAHPAPVIGMGATYTLWTDAYACTVVDVRRGGREVVLQRDKAKLLNGFNSGEKDALTFSPGGFAGHTEGTQRYTYEPNPEGDKFAVSIRQLRNGAYVWKLAGSKTRERGSVARLGRRSEHYDYNF